jgi:signal transduction histidine kinase
MQLDTPRIVGREGERLLRQLARLGLVLALAVAMVPSLAYTVFAVLHEAEDFDALLERRAVILTRHAYMSGPLWRFEVHRVTELMEPAPWELGASIYNVEIREGDRWQSIAVDGKQPTWPSIRREIVLTDGDAAIGRIVGQHDIGHVMELIMLVVASCFILAAGVLMLVQLRAVPFLRASLANIARHEQDLADERASLERLVEERTAELRESNARLEDLLGREREISQQQRRFVAVVSYEFRTPLTITDGAAQRLSRNAERLDVGDVNERVHGIRRAVARMSELIETSLSAARLDSGAITPARERVDLPALLGAVCERIRSIAPEFGIAMESAALDVAVEGDPRLLDQVFTNLITNAVKYSGASRAIEIALSAEGGEAIISVRDHGIGIPAEELPKLFGRFYRASTALGLPGTGIGLNLAHNLVGMHGGRIDVASQVGAGSTFTVRLPRIDAQAAPAAVQAA